ncbi:MAG: DNA protecting protein DprA [Candidatus Omnitrophica bacterium 4484_213]|nr:MAG: DNA protecting protein DprA [Candidatus Omnitrophica bacterium 4484_213]
MVCMQRGLLKRLKSGWGGKNIENWLKLSLSTQIRAEGKALIESFKSPEYLFNASPREVRQRGFKAKIAEELQRVKKYDVSKELSLIKKDKIRIITLLDKDYPASLKSITSAPLVLYVQGEVLAQDCLAIAVVGSRLSSFYGIKTAERLSEELSYRGFTIVSGMARGIDTAAHKGALKSGGRTIAVLGCGLDIVYPRENKKLKEEIIRQGAVVSEFPLGTPPERFNFPIRNRIISGLSLGTVVVEAAKHSGALITANYALEQQREVFAVPGHIDSPTSQGTHQILKEGAKLVEDTDDILEELQPVIKSHLRKLKKKFSSLPPRLSSEEERIYNLLSESRPKCVDELSKEGAFPPGQVLTILSMLELKKIVKRLPGQRFVKN